MPQLKKRGKVDEDKLKQVVIDAEHLGDAKAAKKHRISVRTVIRYRNRVRDDTSLSGAVIAEKAAMMDTWRDQLVAARQRLLTRVVTLAGTSDNLFHVSGALKIVADAANADEIAEQLGGTSGGLGVTGAESDRTGASVAEAPRRALAILSGVKH